MKAILTFQKQNGKFRFNNDIKTKHNIRLFTDYKSGFNFNTKNCVTTILYVNENLPAHTVMNVPNDKHIHTMLITTEI